MGLGIAGGHRWTKLPEARALAGSGRARRHNVQLLPFSHRVVSVLSFTVDNLAVNINGDRFVYIAVIICQYGIDSIII